jgi:riboflavin kinase / FMN adenylyltransferase
MQIHKGLDSLPVLQHAVLTIGTYDGVHAGHQAIIQRINEIAREVDGESVVLTFDPHPRLVLQPDSKDLKLISTISEKIELFERFGLAHLVITPFSKDFASMDAAEYVEQVLVKKFRPKVIVIGYDHRFGKGRQGDIDLLRKLGPKWGYTVEEISVQTIDEISVSSTKVRNALLEGDIRSANQLLAHPFTLCGQVVHGDQIGRTLGFPTANIHVPDPHKLIPPPGVYAVRVQVKNRIFDGALSISFRPTITDSGELRIEVYILDFNEDIYGENIRLTFVDHIRADAKFDSLEDLIGQMKNDVIRVRQVLSN